VPIQTTNAEYDSHVRRASRCRDAVAGSDAIKEQGTKYLPKLSEQSPEEYDAYKTRALFYAAAARTLHGLVGAIMRKDPSIEVPTALDDHLKDVTLTGISFDAFAKMVLTEVLTTGRYGVLVDMPAQEHDIQRPYLAAYNMESIINWSTRVVNGVRTLDLVVLCEQVRHPKSDDPFTFDVLTQYRLLRLNAEQRYEVELYRQNPNKKDEWVSDGILTPTYRGEPFTFIPFCFFGPYTITPDIEKPPLLDLVDVNLSHFRSSADLEHGRHFCGLPMYFFSGITTKDTIPIGSSKAITASDPNARASIIEMNGQGLGALEKALESKERLMAVLGARLLEEQKKTVEAADTLTMRYAGEQSVLRSVAGSVSTGLSKLLEWVAIWSGVSPDEAKTATVKLNTDFMDTSMSFAELESLVRTWQTGAISYETLYYNMQRGEVTRPGIDSQTEKAQAELEAPPDLGNVLDFGSRR
jgi:hypothetical protein